MDELKQKRFLWGIALAWAPWVPTMIGLASAFRGISNTKATGLAAVAGGFTETYVLVGLAGRGDAVVGQQIVDVFRFQHLVGGAIDAIDDRRWQAFRAREAVP